MPLPLNAPVISRISSLLEEINGEKRASVKRADDGTELGHSGSASKDPGGYQGASSHPSAKVDSNTQAAPIGSRFKENHSDMTDEYAVGNVDRTSPGSGGSQDDKQLNIGTNQSATGEDPSVEDKYKGTKEDPGTSHPANAEDTGHKYGSMDVNALTKLAYDRMNECLADMANGVHYRTSSYQPQQTKQAADANLAAQAGYELAGWAGATDFEMEKVAVSRDMLEHFIKSAEADADLVGEYLHRFALEQQRLQKAAEGPPIDPAMMGGGPPGGGMPPGMGGGPPGMGGGPPPDMGGGPPPDMGGGPPPDMGGGPPPDMGGGPPGAGGPGGGGGVDPQALDDLANALMELGIPPEKLIAELQGGGGGGPGGGGPPPGGGPDLAGGAGPAGEKAGSARLSREDRHALCVVLQKVAAHHRSGRMRIKEARPGTQDRADREEIKNYIREVCGIRG